MNLDGLVISSTLSRVDKRKSICGYKGLWEILYPTYTITINGENFEWHNSAYELGKAFGVTGCLYLHEGTIWTDCARRINGREPYSNHFSNGGWTYKADSLKAFEDVARSIHTKKALKLLDGDLLVAVRDILCDALVPFEYLTVGQYAQEFGGTDIDEMNELWHACLSTRAKLKMSESSIRNYLDKLIEMGVE